MKLRKLILGFIFTLSVQQAMAEVKVSELSPRDIDVQNKWEFTRDSFSISDTSSNAKWTLLKGFKSNDSLNWVQFYWLRSTFETSEKETGKVLGILAQFPLPYELYIDGKLVDNTLSALGSVNTSFKPPVLWSPHFEGKHEIYFKIYGPYPWQWRNISSNQIIIIDDAVKLLEASHWQSMLVSSTLLWMSGFFLAMGLVHLIMFFFYRRETANLYYGIFVISIGLIFVSLTILATSTNNDLKIWSAYSMLITSTTAALSIPGIAHILFREKLPLYYKISVLISVLVFFIANWLGGAWYAIIAFIVLYGLVDAFVNVILSIIYRREGAWLLGTGILIFCGFIFFVLLLGLLEQTFSADNFTSVSILFGCLLSVPISMSVYLAFKSARVKKTLSIKLDEVEQLSAKSLQQEQEKQRILETQKEKLESEVAERTREISEQKNIIEEKNKEVTDSIYYAQRIQQSLLATEKEIKSNFNDLGILYKPRDIVSGDFYWAHTAEDSLYIVNGDCTGHGVPGAFMSLLNITYLNEAIKERKLSAPGEILDHVRDRIIHSLSKEENELQDGMDASICRYHKSGKLEAAGANHSIWIFREERPDANALPEGWKLLDRDDANIIAMVPDKMPVGVYKGGTRNFSTRSIQLQSTDVVYVFTDGYPDQFGGEHLPGGKAGGKKFKEKNLQSLLLKLQQKPMHEQIELLWRELVQWKGGLEQVDDICLIGIKI